VTQQRGACLGGAHGNGRQGRQEARRRVMALFGYPVAQDNDAERLVRAVLSIQRALAEMNRKNEAAHKPALAARIAIDTGPAVLDAGGK
jgi:class 3 adenylate cyclase